MTLATEQLSAVETTKEFRALLKYMRAIAKAEPESVKEKFELEEGLWRYASQKAIKAIVGHIDALEFALVANREAQPVSIESLSLEKSYKRAEREAAICSSGREIFRYGLIQLLSETPLYTAPPSPAGEVVVTRNERGDIVAVTRQDGEGRVIEVIAESNAPPAPAVVKLPTEFYSNEGIVVRLEQVMAALAVVGVKCERKSNAKTRCEFPSSEVPEEMTGGIAMSKYKVKKSNYAQWVKGWNACRAAMLAQPVSSGYTFNSPEIPDGWKLVPVEPTTEMINAALASGALSIRTAYRVMLAAAPEGGNDNDTRR
ncbi:hypothetical protein [Serratia bockelmannii]|uniref:hypothetical protein n=1 Tax=Serratia bockelmannii TaxID=2703793 RepID=UPI00301B7E28